MRVGAHPVVCAHADHHVLEIADIAVHVAAIGLQVDDRIADDLAGAVIRDVAAAAGLGDLDAEFSKPFVRDQHVRAAAVALHAKRDD